MRLLNRIHGVGGGKKKARRHGGTEARRHEGADGPTDLDYFYPTSTLVTAREIITLWVARMVMTGLYFMKEVPFSHVHIHPNIQDGTGRRMSKSAGNGVDPVDLIDLYGTDAMRFTLTQMATETQDMRMPVSYLCPHCQTLIPQESVVPRNKVPAQVQKVTCKQCKKPFATVWASDELKQELGVARDTSDRFELGRNFCNKLWQAATGFVLPNVEARRDEGTKARSDDWPRALAADQLALEDHWMLSRLSACIEEVDRRFERYQLNEAANALYAFFWGEFCDWYVELVKPRLFGRNDAGEMVRHDDESARIAQQVLTWVLDQTLRLLHPIMPFVTEELWRRLNEAVPQRGISELTTPGKALIVAPWPDASGWKREAAVEREMQALQDVIRALREIRNHVNGIRSAARESAIKTLPRAVVKAGADLAATLRQREAMIHRLGQCETLEIGSDLKRPPESISKVLSGIEVYVPLSGLADLEIECKRLQKERNELGGHIQRLQGKLANEGFVAKAPPEVVERERTRLTDLREKLAAVERNLAEVGG
jgi:valyl-tRNA synthetase